MSKKPVKIVTIGGGSNYTPELMEGGLLKDMMNFQSRKFGLSILKMGKKN